MTLRAVIWCAVSSEPQAVNEKESLPEQEREARALCEREGWRIVAVLKVPGHSRDYIDIHECAADMRKRKIYAFDRLIELWAERGFDVFICRDGKRFGRTQSLVSYVVEKTISIGAEIWTLNQGKATKENFRQWISFEGYHAAKDNDDRKKQITMGMKGRVKRGFNAVGKPFGFCYERDPNTGKVLLMHPDPARRRMLDDLSTVLLEGVPWRKMGDVLYLRYGHINPQTGARWAYSQLRIIFYNPHTWGHSAYGFADKCGFWVFDDSAPLPSGVDVLRNQHERLYHGDIAEQIKDELRRRNGLHGHSSPAGTYPFSGLLICAECGYTMNVCVRPSRGWYQYRCNSRFMGFTDCRQPRISPATIRHYINDLLATVIQHGDVSLLQPIELLDESARIACTLKDLESEIEQVTSEIRQWAREQVRAKPAVQEVYQQLIDQAGERLEILQREASELRQRQPSQAVARSQQSAIDRLSRLTLDRLWALSTREIHQVLQAVFGDTRILVRDGECIELTKRRRKPGGAARKRR